LLQNSVAERLRLDLFKAQIFWDCGNFVSNSCCCRDCVWICSKHKKFGIVVTLSATPVVAEIAFGFVQSTKNLGFWYITLSATPVAEREMGPQSFFLGASTQ
jgi:hypothetical protein